MAIPKTSTIPGIKAKHAIISDECRINKSDGGAFEEAVAHLREEYKNLLHHWPTGKRAKFHVVLTVEH